MTSGGRGVGRLSWWRVPASVVASVLVASLVAGTIGAPAARATDPGPTAADRVIDAALGYVGLPYLLGREGPDRFDCSGLIFRIFSDAGRVSLIGGRRIRAAGYMRWFAERGQFTTEQSEARRGDLVMYENGKHIGIYLGDGKALSAVLSGVTVHGLHGLTQPVTGFLKVDWNEDGSEGGAPVDLGSMPDQVETPAELIPPSAWVPGLDDPSASNPTGIERPDMRTATSRTFEQEDGTFVTELFARPIHYRTQDSDDWLPVDLRLTPSQEDREVAAVDTSPVRVGLSPARRGGNLVTVSGGEGSIGLAVPGIARGGAVQPILAEDGRFADYSGLYRGQAGLRLFPRADGLKAFLVISERPSSNRFALNLDAPDLLPELAEDGSVTFSDVAQGELAATLLRPLAISSADDDGAGGGVSTEAASLELTEHEGQLRIEVVLRDGYLGRAAYPVFVDLTLTGFGAPPAGATFALSSRPDGTFGAFQRPEWPAYPELWHGRLPGRDAYSEAYLRFAGLATDLDGVTLESVALRMFPYWQEHAQASTWVSTVAGEWEAASLSWGNRPRAGDEIGSFATTAGAWSELDVTDYARSVVAGLPDNGLLLHANELGRRGWKRIVSPAGGDPAGLEPRLVVSWSEFGPLPADPVAQRVSDGTLSWMHAELAPAQWRHEVQVIGHSDRAVVLSSGIVKGAPGRDSSWSVPRAALVPGELYSWRVRARYGQDRPWTDWSPMAAFRYDPTGRGHDEPIEAGGSDEAQALTEQQRPESNESGGRE
jgi:cell wall-associated NlpC family hydrolase